MFEKNYKTHIGNVEISRKKDIEFSECLFCFEPTFQYRLIEFDTERLKNTYKHFLESYYYFYLKANVKSFIEHPPFFCYDHKKDIIISCKIRFLLICVIDELKDRMSRYLKDESSQDFTEEEYEELEESIQNFKREHLRNLYSSSYQGAYYDIVRMLDSKYDNFFDTVSI